MKSKKTDSLVLLATVVLTTGIFVLDLLTPLGVAIWVFYMLPLLIVSRATERLTPFILAAVCTVLIALGFIYSPPGVKLYLAFINRLMGVGVLWTMAVLLVHRSKMEETQKEHENLLRKIIESEPECVKLVSPDGTILEMNPAGLAMIEADSPEQVLGKSIYGIVTPEYRSVFKELTEGVFRGESQMLEFEMVGLKGTHYWLETHAAPLRNQKGEITTLLGITRDITERKRAEKALQVSEERLQLAITGASMGTWHWDIASDELVWSDKCKAIFGIPLDTPMSYECFLDALQAEDREGANQAVMDALNNRTEYDIEYRTVWPDGSIHWVSAKGRGYYDGSGNAVRMEGIALDITERKRAEEALRRNERVLRLFVENSPAAIAMFDRDMKYIVASRRYLMDYALAEQNLVGRSHYEIFPEIPERWKAIHRRCLAGTMEKCDEDPFPRTDGRLDWVRWEIRPWYETTGEVGGVVLFSELITERKWVEEALRESEERLRLALDAAHMGTFDWDIQHNHVTWSHWHEELWGFAPGEFGGTYEAFEQRVHPDDLPGINAEITRCIAAREPFTREFRVVWPGGSVHWVTARGEFTFDASGRPVRMRGAVVETTARKQVEELRAGETRVLAMIATNAPLEQILTSLTLLIEGQSDGMLGSFLLLDEDGLHVRHGAAPSLPETYTKAIDGAPIGPRAGSCGTAMYLGKPVIVTDILHDPLWDDYRDLATLHELRACWSTPIFSSQGRVLGSFAMYYREVRSPSHIEMRLIDIATHIAGIAIERKRAEEAIKNSEQLLRKVIDGLGPYMLVGLMTTDGTLIQANQPALKIAGLKPEDVLGKPFEETYWWSYSEPVKQHLRDSIHRAARGEICRYDEVVRAGENSFITIDFCLRPLFDETGRIIYLIPSAVDITDRKQAEEALKKAYDELEVRVAERTRELTEANIKLKELDRLKSEFLATMSHELRTPLNSIIGFTGIILQGITGEINEEQRKQLSMVYNSAKHLLGLINDILDLSRIESGKIEVSVQRFKVEDVVSEVARSLAPMISQKGLRLITEIPDKTLQIYSDRTRVFQILLNLVNNAVKFTERGEVRIACKADNNNLEMSVSDTGIGIKMESMEMLFQAFRQIDGTAQRRYEGAGLGLHLCKKLVTLLGGRIWAESEYGKGSRFTFTLPLRQEEELHEKKDIGGRG